MILIVHTKATKAFSKILTFFLLILQYNVQLTQYQPGGSQIMPITLLFPPPPVFLDLHTALLYGGFENIKSRGFEVVFDVFFVRRNENII